MSSVPICDIHSELYDFEQFGGGETPRFQSHTLTVSPMIGWEMEGHLEGVLWYLPASVRVKIRTGLKREHKMRQHLREQAPGNLYTHFLAVQA